ncbi:Clavaminate synthase-like protein [Roridomyces roridus]|uniref:Clavaminate synthase-like protein n=1 Tax=Roridomyces roridus TaxID=1738132 RepID=A0AAD7BPD6_9AGAR|nr:Clavaminate synthase-like protein [Roridomyces roridus]
MRSNDQHQHPPFPEDVPTCPLFVIDYELIKARDEREMERLWDAGTTLGFWYLKNHGVSAEVGEMFDFGAETVALPLEEKLAYEQGDQGDSFGYKAAGSNVVDASGTRDITQFINVAADDAFAWPDQVRRSYPSSVSARMTSTIRPFVEKSWVVNDTLIDVFNEKLGLKPGRLAELHTKEEFSGSAVRVVYNPAVLRTEAIALSAHTDFGSLSFLHNRLGGLQVLPPGPKEWQYVKPIPGHAICNIGDALVILSGGILRSNIHRVVAPPGDQAAFERYSLVYFTRPANTVVLRALAEDSSMIAEAVESAPDPKRFDPGATALEWLTRRVRERRAANQKVSGPLVLRIGLTDLERMGMGRG